MLLTIDDCTSSGASAVKATSSNGVSSAGFCKPICGPGFASTIVSSDGASEGDVAGFESCCGDSCVKFCSWICEPRRPSSRSFASETDVLNAGCSSTIVMSVALGVTVDLLFERSGCDSARDSSDRSTTLFIARDAGLSASAYDCSSLNESMVLSRVVIITFRAGSKSVGRRRCNTGARPKARSTRLANKFIFGASRVCQLQIKPPAQCTHADNVALAPAVSRSERMHVAQQAFSPIFDFTPQVRNNVEHNGPAMRTSCAVHGDLNLGVWICLGHAAAQLLHNRHRQLRRLHEVITMTSNHATVQ